MSAATDAPIGNSRADPNALRFAMLSIYYDCLSRGGSLGGAPAILLPLPGGPLSLADALAELRKAGRGAMRDGVWSIVRATPVDESYPSALAPALEQLDSSLQLSALDELRNEYRAGANLLGAALVACVENKQREFNALRRHMKSLKSEFDEATEGVLGMTASDFLKSLDDKRTSDQLRQLRDQVRLDLYQYAVEFADAVAFDNWWRASEPMPDGGPAAMTVYPDASVIQQDLRTLITQVTVTALVRCDDFETLKISTDPQCWKLASDVMDETRYVKGCYELTPVTGIPPGQGYEAGEPPPFRFLEERVKIPSGLDGQAETSFHNVLRINRFNVVDKKRQRTITVKFSLARCIDSRVLWDKRGGGLLVDQGFIIVRQLTEDRWRLTSRKTILFSNRMPNMSATGWFDLGQMLNVLAPAALSWWLESEIYSVAKRAELHRSKGASDAGSE